MDANKGGYDERNSKKKGDNNMERDAGPSNEEVDERDVYITDRWKRQYHFKITTYAVPDGIVFDAIEVKEDNSTGYKFSRSIDFSEDMESAKQAFLERIRKRLNQRHLKKYQGKWEFGARQILRGRIGWNEDLSDTRFDKVLVIDGKRITIEEFGDMLEAYEGWRFKFQLLDPDED